MEGTKTIGKKAVLGGPDPKHEATHTPKASKKAKAVQAYAMGNKGAKLGRSATGMSARQAQKVGLGKGGKK